VPLYLAPVTLDARQWDLDWLAPLRADRDGAAAGVVGHHLFTSGQEWGYWLIDYCVARMVWDPAFTQTRCLDDFTGQLAASAEIRAVLRTVQERQVREVRDPEILRFLVGSDGEIETAERVGLHFHPLPPAPADVAAWDDGQVDALRRRSLQPLAEIAVAYHAFAARIEALLPRQSPAQAPWVREIRDGLRAYALRAEHDGAPAGVLGHHLFTSGQEWGYWLIDYCVARAVWDPAFTQSRCLDDFTGQLAGAGEIRAVLHAVQERQVREVRDV